VVQVATVTGLLEGQVHQVLVQTVLAVAVPDISPLVAMRQA
jgi:hypothetical protein